MSEELKPFFVDLSPDEAGQAGAPAGRYLVISVQIANSPLTTSDFMIVFVCVRVAEGPRRVHIINSTRVTFVGFRGDCLMCSKRPPEEIGS